MQRLYEAADRIEAYENRAGEGGPDGPPDGDSETGAEGDAPAIEPPPKAGDDPAAAGADDGADDDDNAEPAGGADDTRVALPEGRLVEPEAAEAAPVETAGERAGTVLKAERVML